MITLFRTIIRPYLYLQYLFYKHTGTGPFGKKEAIYINPEPPSNGNRLKQALFRHHIKQYHEASCSVASVVSVINAVKDSRNQLNGTPLTQQGILDTVRTAYWKERMAPGGHNGKRGLPLATLGDVVKSSLEHYEIPYKQIDIVRAPINGSESVSVKRELILRLHEFETSGNCLIIAHFNQGSYVKALQIPHISPVGGYDKTDGTVTMLDVDPLQENPYKLSFDTFYKGLSSNYNNLFRSFGYENGGYVFVRLK